MYSQHSWMAVSRFSKKSTEFSGIPLDQIHEQNNAYIKEVAGETHLVNRTDEARLI